MPQNQEFFIPVNHTEKRLFISRPESINAPSCMTPDDVDYEMSTGKHPEILFISGMNQESLEYFVKQYGKDYRYLEFFHCQLIRDFSPLEDLTKLEEVSVHWNIRAEKLWNFNKNEALKTLTVNDAKKLTLRPDMVKTSAVLENVFFCGGMFNNYTMESLDCFAGMPSLKHLKLYCIRLADKRMDALNQMPALERFDFDAGMLTTEEIARIVAKYPHLSGQSLCAYNTEDAVVNDVRVCGFRKPALDLPQHQKQLDKYIAEFQTLVEQYRTEH